MRAYSGADAVRIVCSREGRGPRTVIVAAHPDDETVGAGSRFRYFRDPVFVHVTDGAPRAMHDALAAGFSTREEYGQARRRELHEALRLVSVSPAQCIGLGIADQEASFALPLVARAVRDLLKRTMPGIVLTHSYEGGHPDHDAAAFGVHAACRMLEQEGIVPPPLVEYALYRADRTQGGKMAVFEFLPHAGCGEMTVALNREESALKRGMLRCFPTQKRVLGAFPVSVEKFRPAPQYVFTRPPHEGTLYYENFDWGVYGEQWRDLAGEALEELGILRGVPAGRAGGEGGEKWD
ncbi:MAG: PIG-L family deacetylase [Alphaproteobacteria bacterium]|uniref:PIG-L family deacetylase n=1 Tax=Candidatus Nitrobium versatile TaxID=2884831 RepID=A0A953M2B9_9BACT|nr:PIG-L family deacetylase [Candidatus Nitrobium versatile]